MSDVHSDGQLNSDEEFTAADTFLLAVHISLYNIWYTVGLQQVITTGIVQEYKFN